MNNPRRNSYIREKILEQLPLIIKPSAKKYLNKEIVKAMMATKFIGKGVNPVIDNQLNDIYQLIDIAIEAKACFIMDTLDHINKTQYYNIGEIALADYLSHNNYIRVGTSGFWKPKNI